MLQPHHSMSEEAASHTYACRPLQRLFRPYPKPTPYLHLYLCLRLNNQFYKIKLMFDTSTNPMLHCLYKLTFWHHHNKLCHHLTFVNISRWTLHKSYRHSPPSRTVLQPLQITSTSLYRTLLLSIFLLQSFVLNHISNAWQHTTAKYQPMPDDS